MAWFRALPLIWRLASGAGVLVVILGVVGGLYAYVRHQGYVAGYAKAAAECAAEKAAQEAANRKAISDAEKELFRVADQISLKKLELDNVIAQIDEATGADPDGGAMCLTADSVRRLQAIR